MEASACLPSLQVPTPSHNLRAFGCRYLDLVSTGEDETRSGSSRPRVSDSRSLTQKQARLGRAWAARSKGGTLTDALRRSQTTAAVEK